MLANSYTPFVLYARNMAMRIAKRTLELVKQLNVCMYVAIAHLRVTCMIMMDYQSAVC